jgi:hypothetical protein
MAGMHMDVDFSGLIRQLGDAADSGLPAVKVGLYETAGKVAGAIRQEAGTLPYQASTVQQIQQAIGIAKFTDTADGSDTSISVDGYFAESGFPIIFFAREVEHGTSWLQANPFMRRGYNRAKAEAEAAGNRAAEQYIQRILDNIKDT